MTDKLRHFERIAVVNRGEPAMRLLRAVREWNAQRSDALKAIALFTEPDREALYVREADASFCLGPAMFLDEKDLDEAGKPRRKSRYLDYGRLREALVQTGAEAAWVGWGFVAEHAEFAELCRELGIAFIGPPPEAMRRLGDKIGSKRLAESAGVPVAPWSGGPVATVEEARACAAKLGYPLLVKATAGGGGRGIRFVHEEKQLAEAFNSASAEARKAFGDGTVFLESKVGAARHVEVQVLADESGTTWAVGVRDCSAQRCSQKVIEEAPAPALSPEREKSVREAAVRLAKAAGYVNAGTAEFLYEPAGDKLYFMEMNTRLQVEHPVTEATTGLDLVRAQIAIARGEKLEGEPPPARGHAIEVRLCAEDPDRGFAPAPGRVAGLRPALGPGLRTDTGIREGEAIPVEFDSMIAKVIAHGSTREEARARLIRALHETLVVVEGGTTNRAFLLRLLKHPDFASSQIDTGWIDRLMQKGFSEPAGRGATLAMLAAAIDLHERQLREEELNFFASAARGRPMLSAQARRPIELRYGGVAYEFRVATLEPGSFRVEVDGVRRDIKVESDGPYERRLCFESQVGLQRHRVVCVANGLDFLVEVDGASYRISRDPGGVLRAPAPGLVLALHAAPGAQVKAGERLLSLEAMKMEMPVVAPFDGRVRQLFVAQSVQVGAGDPLLVLEPLAHQASEAGAAARLSFNGVHAPPADSLSAARAAFDELRRLMLGFDISDDRITELFAHFTKGFPDEVLPSSGSGAPVPEGLQLFSELFALYLDVEALFSKRYARADSQLSLASALQIFLREYSAEGRGLPEEFLKALNAALARYGATLQSSERLRDALIWIFRSHQQLSRKDKVLTLLLQASLQRPGWRDAAQTTRVRELLDRLVAVTVEPSPKVCDLAQQLRYVTFEGQILEERRGEVMRRVDAALERLSAEPESDLRAALMADLVASPFALAGHLTKLLPKRDPLTRTNVLEVLSRRIYRTQSFSEPCPVVVDGQGHLTARCVEGGRFVPLITSCCSEEEVSAQLDAIFNIAEQFAAPSRALADLFVDVTREADERAEAAQLASQLGSAGLSRRISRISIAMVHPGPSSNYYTFVSRDGAWVEEEGLRGLHPATAERLEFARLRDFKIRRVASAEDLYLFHGVARSHEKDERLFAIAEVRQLHPRRDASGKLVALPEIERAILLAFQAIRGIQSRRDARQRLPWNRVTVFVRPALVARREEILEIIRQLQPWAINLGLEKIVLRALLQESAAHVPQDVAIRFMDRNGARLEMSVAEPHTEPLRVLDDYSLKLIRARQRGLTYAYEIVRMLTPAEAREDFPAGRFEEFDFGEDSRTDALISVEGRPYGLNSANLVVGVVESFTEKHREGMKRVLIVGDGTREMGALAEPECKRIIAAIDLAERLKVPLEWFPVSSGAKIAMDSGTENLDWTAAVLRRIIEFTQGGGEINIVVDGINVGAQSYWNAEATMLMHTRGVLIMTPRGTMLLTGKRALDYSGGVSAEDNLGIGGLERIMGPNGQAQYQARDLDEACRILMRHYEHTYLAPGERHPRRRPSSDPVERDVCSARYLENDGFGTIGDLWSDEKNPGRKKPFSARALMRAVADADAAELERWSGLRDGESAVIWDTHLGGWPVCLVGIESRPLPRLGYVPSDGPESWSGGTLFPLSSKKVARALNSASGNRPAVVLANLSGFDGSPESMRRLQLEYGAEIGRAVVNFKGPLVFCVVARYHGGAYVVFSKALNPSLTSMALNGSYASVIGGAPAAAVVFPDEARALALKDSRVAELDKRLKTAGGAERPRMRQAYEELLARVRTEKTREIAEKFDSIHSVQRALKVGSLDAILDPSKLRPALIAAVEEGLAALDFAGGVEPVRPAASA
jgi:acetyl/propionyl-CoA carboxylase alpha subunit/acetyl-CoA carboxylase carboxyltransferase component